MTQTTDKLIKAKQYLVTLLERCADAVALSDSAQTEWVRDVWLAENRENGAWLHFPYCCEDCDGSFPYKVADLRDEILSAIRKIEES
jgi:hypothetical protein